MKETSIHQSAVSASIIKKLVEEGALLLDVRTHCEYAGYHIEGSLNIPYDEIQMMEPFLRSIRQPVIIYSSRGRRSEIACQKLKQLELKVFNAGTMHDVEVALRGESDYEIIDPKR